MVRLDDDVEELGVTAGAIDLIKIDVEGMELDSVTGAMATLAGHGPAVFVETRDHRATIDKLLAEVGYCPLVPVNTPAGADYATVPARSEEFLRTALAVLEA